MKEAQEHLKFKYKNITADAGYESEENYVFLEANGQHSYIKPANYEISKTCKHRNDIGKIENMEYDAESDLYICRNAKRLTADHIRHKGNNWKTPLEERTKTLQVAKTFLKYRQEDLERILSEEGI